LPKIVFWRYTILLHYFPCFCCKKTATEFRGSWKRAGSY
jgi:hypothetical protein